MAFEDGIRYEDEYVFNSRGIKLFTCRWLPTNQEPKALIFLCHGYAMECSISNKGAATRLAKAGFGVYGMDYEGHGKSEGLQGLVTSFDNVVSDCSEHYTNICEKKENVNKLRIIMGESMGGAVVLLLHRKKPTFWHGAVLIAPMCKIADDIKPNAVVISILTKLRGIIPTWKIIPGQDIVDLAFRDLAVRQEIRSNKFCYKGRPRLQTGAELLNTSLELEQRLDEVSIPFLLVHGAEDKVTDPTVSKLLFETAKSKDKTFKLYPEMWHSLSYGELPENMDIVFSDIISWLSDRVDTKLELQQKLENDVIYKGSAL